MKSKYEYIRCPLCKKNDYDKIIVSIDKKKKTKKFFTNIFNSSSSVFDEQIVKCNSCNFIYLNPRINQKIINKGYSYSQDKKFVSQNKIRVKTFKNTLEIIDNRINLSNKKILDIGSGGGAFLKACKDIKIQVEGIEPNKWLVKYAKKKYNVNISSKKIYNIKKSFDVVSLFDVLEHIPNLQSTVNEITRLVKKNGHLIINVPDHDSLARKLLKTKWPFYLNVHLHYFNERTLSKLLEKRFKLVYSKPYWQNLEINYIMERAAKYFSFLNILKKLLVFLDLDKFSLKYNMGQTLFIFKKK